MVDQARSEELLVERYGYKHLSIEDKTKVKEGTLLARRARSSAISAHSKNKPWIFEQPHWRPGGTSMYMLDEFVELAAKVGVQVYTFDQCEFGAEFEKKTDLMSNIEQDIMQPFTSCCTHEKRWWVIPWCCEEILSSHPPLRGRQMAIPWEDWQEDMLRAAEPKGDYLTRTTAAYPSAMNEQLVKCLKLACERRAASTQKKRKKTPDQHEHHDAQVTMLEPLTGLKSIEEDEDNNGLRNVHKWISPRMMYLGKQLQNLISRWIDESRVQEEMLSMLGKQAQIAEETQEKLQQLRMQVRDLLVRNKRQEMEEVCSIDKVDTADYQTEVRGELLSYWARCVDDPAQRVALWLTHGAPAGLTVGTEELDGVFPRVDNAKTGDIEDLSTQYSTFTNYSGVEDNAEATSALQSYVEKGYLKKFSTLQELQAFVGGKPILSKIDWLHCEAEDEHDHGSSDHQDQNHP